MAPPTTIPLPWHRRLHADERGNLGILLLLTIWSLVGLIALVWNSAEYATRRRHVQSAADAAAHSANLWTSRTTNLTAASSMTLSQNGSAEIILRSVAPTHTIIQKRFDSERQRATQLLTGSIPSTPEENYPDCEYFEELIGSGAWAGKGRGDNLRKDFDSINNDMKAALAKVLPLLQAQQAQQLQQRVGTGLQDNDAAMHYLMEQYLGSPGASGGGGGVASSVADWIANGVRPRLNDILSTLDVEQTWLDRWVAQTDPALSSMTPEQLRDVREEIYAYQQQIHDLTPSVIQEQRAAIAAFYQVDLTTSVPGRRNELSLPTDMDAPIKPSRDLESKSHTDSIRQRYPDATFRHFGDYSPEITVDPVNVNVDRAVIWHPGASVDAPPVSLAGRNFTGTWGVGGGNWGRVPCAPLSRYMNGRVYRDRDGLRQEPQAIDQERDNLRGRVYPPPSPPGIPDLPQRFGQSQTSPGIPLPPPRIPSLPVPPGLSAADEQFIRDLDTRITKFDSDLRTYVRQLRGLKSALSRMYSNLSTLADTASQRFADSTWLRQVELARQFVFKEIGWDRPFMVLTTYELRKIPDWATSGMHESVRQYVYNQIYSRSIANITASVRSRLLSFAIGALNAQQQAQNGGRGGGRNNVNGQAQQFANQNASWIAQDITRRAAQIVAMEVADEWVQRWWPFEIEPPTQPVPPTRGLTDDERKHYFTSLMAAVTTDDTAAKPALPKLFWDEDKTPKVFTAFAQAETFNWMEYNENYGAGDAYDRITYYGHGDMGGSPRPWRVSTTGGWNWQPRLALSDAIDEAMADGQDFSDYLEKGGVSRAEDGNAIKTVTRH